MTEIKLTDKGEKMKEITLGIELGHIDAVLSKKADIMKLTRAELDRLSVILEATKVAGHHCCTGG